MDTNSKNGGTYKPSEGEQFFFMHIPKTGGTTFRKMLTNYFHQDSYYPSHVDLINNNGKYFSQKDLIENHSSFLKKSLLIGHYNMDLVPYLNPNVKIIAFFRNPLDRLLSHVNHLIKHDLKLKGKDPNYIIKNRIGSLSNVLSRSMGFKPKSNNFNIVLKSIKKLDFIGIMENYDESLKDINRKYNWDLKYEVIENASSKSLYDSLTPKTKSLIACHLGKDIFTYRAAVKEASVKKNIF